jgi:ubiquinone biosynthesis protein UbiJ
MTARPPHPLLVPLGRALERVIDRALALDPAARERLAALEGRSIEMTWAPADLGLRMRVVDGRVAIGPREGEGDLSLSGTLVGFVRLLQPSLAGKLPPGRVQMNGDADLARTLGQLAEQFRPDLERALVPLLGESAAGAAATSLREAFDWARRGAGSLAGDAAEYLQEESAATPPRPEIEDFHADVDRLRDDVERLEARLKRLAAALEQRS